MDTLFGSETRGRVLNQLAETPIPQTAYRIAKAVGAEPIQVLRILKSLPGVIAHSTEGWTLENELLRRFLLDRLTHEASNRRAEKDELLVRFGLSPSFRRGRQ